MRRHKYSCGCKHNVATGLLEIESVPFSVNSRSADVLAPWQDSAAERGHGRLPARRSASSGLSLRRFITLSISRQAYYGARCRPPCSRRAAAQQQIRLCEEEEARGAFLWAEFCIYLNWKHVKILKLTIKARCETFTVLVTTNLISRWLWLI